MNEFDLMHLSEHPSTQTPYSTKQRSHNLGERLIFIKKFENILANLAVHLVLLISILSSTDIAHFHDHIWADQRVSLNQIRCYHTCHVRFLRSVDEFTDDKASIVAARHCYNMLLAVSPDDLPVNRAAVLEASLHNPRGGVVHRELFELAAAFVDNLGNKLGLVFDGGVSWAQLFPDEHTLLD